jgi:hypothetical protein
MTAKAWGLLGCLVVILLLGMCGCGEAADGCERSAYELERTRYRCTSEGELQTLNCGEWVTLAVCAEPETCSPGPEPGCD